MRENIDSRAGMDKVQCSMGMHVQKEAWQRGRGLLAVERPSGL